MVNKNSNADFSAEEQNWYSLIPDASKVILAETSETAEDTPLPFFDRRAEERELLSTIQMGNISLLETELRKIYDNFDSNRVGVMSRESLNQARYLCVAIVTLSCRAAIDAGVLEQLAYALSDGYIQHLDKLFGVDQVMEFMAEVFRGFCQLVHDFRLRKMSKPVRQCCEYMQLKLTTTVTLKELSTICHLSPNYITDLFRKELGMGALQYYHDQKLKYAYQLLLHSDLSITAIAAKLSYPSHSNFTQRFKKTYGMTPTQYRQSKLRSI